MARINLRDYYPEYTLNCFIEVTDGDEEAVVAALTKEVADVYVKFQRKENAYMRRKYYNKAHYSLNRGDGIENDAVDHAPSAEDVFFDNLAWDELKAAIASLSKPQRRRVNAYVIHGMRVTDIALAEGAAKSSVSESVSLGLQNIKNNLKNYF